ncbi:MAG: hypothetical protein AAFY10_09990 [Pseudomonadota bacterium]
MTADERFNESQKTRAQFLNALAVGFIVAGGFTAFRDGDGLLTVAAILTGIILHDGALRSIRAMRTA